ncbi:DNA methylase, partial [Escherichia coli]
SGWLFYVCSVKAAMSLGRRAIGVELETERFEQTVREVQDLVSQNG